MRERQSILWDWALGTGAIEWSGQGDDGALSSASELVTEQRWLQAIVGDDRDRVASARLEGLSSALQRWSVAYRIALGSGPSVSVLERGSVAQDSNGRPFHAAGMLELVGDDSPQRVSQEPALSADQLALFFDWLPQLAWSTTADGWIDFYNQRWYAYTGTTFEQMEGWGWIRVHDPDDIIRVTRIYRRAFATGQAWEDEFRLRRASDGMMRWHLSRAMPVRDASGAIVRRFGTNTDIHDQKLAAIEHSRLLARAESARAEAEAANEARDRFLAMVSHELRTPLNAVLGWAQLLNTGSIEPSRASSILGKIESNARLQAKLIDDLLDVSRMIGGKLLVGSQPIDLASAADLAVDTVKAASASAGVEIVVTHAQGPTVILGERERVVQILVNLLTNAIKFGKTGRRVELTLESDEKATSVTVRDFGVGLTAEQAAMLFAPFWQADTSTTRKHGGLGLGLAITRHLVELHGGTIAVSSDGPGSGATFRVSFPNAHIAHDATPVGERNAISLSGLRILVVDDEQSAREVLAAALLSAGANVSTAGSVSEALRVLRAGTYDAVISDLAMPEVDGYELAPRARELPGYAKLPLIALTAFAGEADRAAALRAGFDRHITKPIEIGAVAACVVELVRTRLVGGHTA